MATAHTPELVVYDGQECTGGIKVAADGAARTAFGQQGKQKRGNRD